MVKPEQNQNLNNLNLLKILVAIAWIDGEIQPEERKFLEKIAVEHSLESTAVEELLNKPQDTSPSHCYELLQSYLGTQPDESDYQSLLSAVSSLIYSDDDIATEEASLLTQMQNLDPTKAASSSTLDKAIAKIQKLYRAGLKRV